MNSPTQHFLFPVCVCVIIIIIIIISGLTFIGSPKAENLQINPNLTYEGWVNRLTLAAARRRRPQIEARSEQLTPCIFFMEVFFLPLIAGSQLPTDTSTYSFAR